MSRCISLALLAAAAVLCARAPAQAPRLSPDEMKLSSRAFRPAILFRARVNEVQVGVVVRNGQGRSVAGLTRGDFQVLDNGRPQPITAFNVEARSPEIGATARSGAAPPPVARPRFIAFLFDDLNTEFNQQADLAQARAAAAIAEHHQLLALGS